MWAQEEASTSTPVPPASPPQASSLAAQIQAANPPLPNVDGLSHEELVLYLQQALAQINTYELKLRQLENAGRLAAQEHVNPDPDRDHSQGGGSQQPQPAPEVVRPEVRIVLPDTMGMRVEHPSDEPRHGQSAGHSGTSLVVSSVRAGPVDDGSSQHLVAVATMPLEQKCEVLIQALDQSQAALMEEQQKTKTAVEMGHSLLTQLNASLMARKELEDSTAKLTDINTELTDTNAKLRDTNAKLRDEVVTKDNQIKDLKQKFPQPRNSPPQPLSLRPGVKRGRFLMSKACTMECSNCQGFFHSAEDAFTSECWHHPRSACPLPNKMAAKVFPAESSRQRYWPCCQQIGTKAPPPCCRGMHDLRVL